MAPFNFTEFYVYNSSINLSSLTSNLYSDNVKFFNTLFSYKMYLREKPHLVFLPTPDIPSNWLNFIYNNI